MTPTATQSIESTQPIETSKKTIPEKTVATTANSAEVVEPVITEQIEKAEAKATVDTKQLVANANPTIAQQFPDPGMQKFVIQELNNYGFQNVTLDSFITDEMIEAITYIYIYEDPYDPDRITVNSLEGISIFKNIQNISFANISIKEIPKEIEKLQKLEYIYSWISLNLEKVPAEIWNLNLRNFHLYGAVKLKEYPDIPLGSAVLSSLETFHAWHTAITDLSFLTNKPFKQLNNLSFHYNHLVQLPDDDVIPFLTDSDYLYLQFDYNQLVSIPQIYLDEYLKNGNIYFYSGMLHPDIANQFGAGSYDSFQLALKSDNTSIKVQDGTLSIPNILFEYVKLNGMMDNSELPPLELSRAHDLQFVDIVDENGNPVDLADYYVDGVVIQSGKLYARIRSMPGENAIGELSPFAVTEQLELIFEIEVKPVTIQYVDQNGNVIRETVTHLGELDEPFNFSAPNIPGYKYVGVEGETNGVYGAYPHTITFIYEKIEETVAPPEVGTDPDAGQNNNSGTTPSQTFNKQPVSSQRTNAQVSAMGVLPQTNGVSTALSTTAGALLVLGSVMILWSRRKNIKQ